MPKPNNKIDVVRFGYTARYNFVIGFTTQNASTQLGESMTYKLVQEVIRQ